VCTLLPLLLLLLLLQLLLVVSREAAIAAFMSLGTVWLLGTPVLRANSGFSCGIAVRSIARCAIVASAAAFALEAALWAVCAHCIHSPAATCRVRQYALLRFVSCSLHRFKQCSLSARDMLCVIDVSEAETASNCTMCV
jgi:hypothetical protein